MKLNLGAGPNVFPPPWVNLDIDDVNETFLRHMAAADSFEGWPAWQRELGSQLKAGMKFRVVRGDLMDLGEWPRPDHGGIRWDYCDAIYLGQVVEHLNPIHELPALLTRCYGALKPGGVLRITTPDLGLLLRAHAEGRMQSFASEQPEFYMTAHPDTQLAYLLFGATGPSSTRKNYEGHMHAWTPETLWRLARDCGFDGEPCFDWPSKRLPDVRDFGKSHSFALELVK